MFYTLSELSILLTHCEYSAEFATSSHVILLLIQVKILLTLLTFFGVSNKNFQNLNLLYLNRYYYTGPTKSKWSNMLGKFILVNPEYSNKYVPSIIHS